MSHKPFMYIEQPNLKEVTAPMQADYHSNSRVDLRQTNESREMPKNNTKFSDLSIDDKIHYLLHLPREVPAIRCEIQTAETDYRGIVIEEEAEEVEFRILGRGYKTIKKNDIKQIKLLGF